jgi:hypothetical protein
VKRSHWADYHRLWNRLMPPQRPHPEAVAAFGHQVGGHGGRLLLLGMTPELASLGTCLVAVDRNRAMIGAIWPGDRDDRWAIQADWLSLPFAPSSFTAAIGDGSFNNLLYPSQYRGLFDELVAAVQPGGRLVMRVFVSPDRPERLGQLRHAAFSGQGGSFHAFKWRLASAIIAESGDPNIPVQQILDGFKTLFPDRGALAEAASWPIDDIATIDAYRGSADVYSFPTVAQFRATLPPAVAGFRVGRSGAYELAERCPLMIMEIA